MYLPLPTNTPLARRRSIEAIRLVVNVFGIIAASTAEVRRSAAALSNIGKASILAFKLAIMPSFDVSLIDLFNNAWTSAISEMMEVTEAMAHVIKRNSTQIQLEGLFSFSDSLQRMLYTI